MFYLLQRIPMIVLKHFGVAEEHKYFFVIISFAVTVLLTLVFNKFNEKFISKLKIINPDIT